MRIRYIAAGLLAICLMVWKTHTPVVIDRKAVEACKALAIAQDLRALDSAYVQWPPTSQKSVYNVASPNFRLTGDSGKYDGVGRNSFVITSTGTINEIDTPVTSPQTPPVMHETGELSTANLIARSSNADPADRQVKPGDVIWERDKDTALLKARQSGKPVLIFVMLGQLDNEFC